MGLFTKKTNEASGAADNTPAVTAPPPPKPVAPSLPASTAASSVPPSPPPMAGAPSATTSKSARGMSMKGKQAKERFQKFHELKGMIHRKLVDQLDMTKLEKDASEELRDQVRRVVLALCEEEDTLLNTSERQRLAQEILDETFGLGPLETLLADPKVSDILINGSDKIYVERGGMLTLTDVKFKDDGHLLHIIDKIVSPLGRRCDEVSPMVDARLKDGSRVNAIIPPLAIDGPAMSIRRFGSNPVSWEDYLNFKSCSSDMIDFFEACVRSGLNILIAGGTGSGKTTLLNNLSGFIPENERIVTIEDAAELQLHQPHVVRLETRPPNLEGKGQITMRDLLVNSLRMRPDRIVVGECRGGETLDMLQAMNTGHEGSMTTIHANNTRDCVQRIETMVMMSGIELPQRAIRQQFTSAINLIVQSARLTGGRRKIVAVTEVQGMEGEMAVMQDIFKFEQDGVDAEGRAYGRIIATGVRPLFMDRLISHGAKISPDLFQPRDLVADFD